MTNNATIYELLTKWSTFVENLINDQENFTKKSLDESFEKSLPNFEAILANITACVGKGKTPNTGPTEATGENKLQNKKKKLP